MAREFPVGSLRDALKDRPFAKMERRCVNKPIGCGGDASIESFRDSLSLREYEISALCQKCQDEVFTGHDED